MSNGNGSVAPHCPISHSQQPTNPHGHSATRLPAIPIATDLPSLIRSVNIMRDILRNITTSLTINNTYMPRAPRQPKIYGDRTYNISPYPDWYQVEHENEAGYVGKDPKARAHVERLHKIVYRNNERDDDNLFKWLYKLPLTGRGEGSVPPFKEDFFERVVKVKWKKEGPPRTYVVEWTWLFDPLSTMAISQIFEMRQDYRPNEWGSILVPGSATCTWKWGRRVMTGKSPNATFSGEPTITDGSATECFVPRMFLEKHVISGEDYYYREIRGESGSCPIIVQTVGGIDWYGPPPTPFGDLYPHWFGQAPSQYSTTHPGPGPYGAPTPISWALKGPVVVTASGITGTANEDGAQLVKTETVIHFGPWAATVVVRFKHPDD